ncbi:MAG: DNA recombination protein RmuC [Burkholderiaceae bacterium]|nr:DNA recombination protein RmuC [Burkholderiaceae bacterium]
MDLFAALIALVAGLVIGALAMALKARGRHAEHAALQERQRLTEIQHAEAARLNAGLRDELSGLQRQLAEVSTRLEEERKQSAEKIRLLQEMSESARKALTEEFQNLANGILEDKTRRFSQQNIENLGNLLNPFKERLTEFKQRVEEIHYQDAQQQAMLKAELAQLKDLNRQMTEEAHELATALKGQAKKQGNWGELVLENVLARSGLQLGKDYRREVSFSTEEGKQRPDVIIYLPEDKHLIVDAKVSLNAYTRYVNAEEEVERKQALRDHVKAVADRIAELADRRYFDLGDLNSPEMVFMFVPIESAFVEALRADENLFQQALERNVLVATPTTLLTSLNIVRQLWRLENQNAHSAALADSASRLYHKFTVFLGTMEELGRKLDAARGSYAKAFGQLYEGPGNLIKRAKEFEQLGVAVKGALPQYLVDKAELEIELLPPTVEPEAAADDPPQEDRAA